MSVISKLITVIATLSLLVVVGCTGDCDINCECHMYPDHSFQISNIKREGCRAEIVADINNPDCNCTSTWSR